VTSAFDGVQNKADVVEQGLRKFYPNIASARITHRWGGAVDRTRSGTLAFGTLRESPNICYGIGYSGTGVAQTVVGGKILASTALERVDQWSTSRLNQGPVILYPPDPIKFFGGIAVRAALTAKEEGEEDGTPVHTAIAKLGKIAYPTLPRDLDRSRRND
jgi:hypothetical protein